MRHALIMKVDISTMLPPQNIHIVLYIFLIKKNNKQKKFGGQTKLNKAK